MSNCGFYTKRYLVNFSPSFTTYCSESEIIIKDANHLGQLSEGAILCTNDLVGLYPNIPHEESLASLRKFLNARTEEKVTTEILAELAQIVLKNKSFSSTKKL